MPEGLDGVLPSVAILGAIAVAALLLTLTREPVVERGARTSRAARIAALTVAGQAAHFLEELLAGFHERFPAIFGLPAIPRGLFVAFNVVWILVWLLSARALAALPRAALFPLWFLAIGCLVNVVAHPALSILEGGYFPGLATSPVVGLLGVMLVRSLIGITTSSPGSDATG